MTVAKQAVARAQREGLAGRSRERRDSFEESDRDSFEESDEVWAVFDRDAHPNFSEAVTLCEQKGVKVARSDPCFELWLILHESNYDKACTRRDVQRVLESRRSEYDKDGAKTPDCDALVSHVADAERRGDDQLRRREEEGKPFGNPSTTVGRLARALREADRKARPRG